MEEKEQKLQKSTPVKRRKKTWGDEGFVTKVQYGAYDYTVKFIKEENIRKFVGQEDENIRVFGGINCYEQEILISSEASLQTQKCTLLHELVHAVLLRNGTSVDEDDVDTLNVTSEELVDSMALGFYELMRRNPELMRWLMK